MKAKEEFSEKLPTYLQELIDPPTPSNVQKVVAVWDSLQIENQISLLRTLSDSFFEKDRLPIFRHALNSSNVYIRHIAALHLNKNGNQKDKIKIEIDPAPLVRYVCPLEFSEEDFEPCDGTSGRLILPEKFFSLPQDARLSTAYNRQLNIESLANIIEYFFNTKPCSENDFVEVLREYFLRSSEIDPEKFYLDNNRLLWREFPLYFDDCPIKKIWRLVPKVSKSVSNLLLEFLPEAEKMRDCYEYYRIDHRTFNEEDYIPSDVLECLEPEQIETLLLRPDIRLFNFRKKIASTLGENFFAAARYNYKPTDEDLGMFMSLNPEKAEELLFDLLWARDLPLYMLYAIKDWGNDHDTHAYGDDEQRLKLIAAGGGETEEFLLTWLYIEASKAASLGEAWHSMLPKKLSDVLRPLDSVVVRGDKWGTFIAFRQFVSWDFELKIPYLLGRNENPNGWWERSAIDRPDLN